jgi:uncharacterized protein YjiS (DUF1127 family)
MQALQGGLAARRVVSHMQHSYLAPHGRRCPRNTQIEKEHPMAAIETSRPAPFGAIATYRIVSALGRAAEAVTAWNDARVTRKALSKLSDHELDDIGLCRGDVDLIGR